MQLHMIRFPIKSLTIFQVHCLQCSCPRKRHPRSGQQMVHSLRDPLLGRSQQTELDIDHTLPGLRQRVVPDVGRGLLCLHLHDTGGDGREVSLIQRTVIRSEFNKTWLELTTCQTYTWSNFLATLSSIILKLQVNDQNLISKWNEPTALLKRNGSLPSVAVVIYVQYRADIS